MSSFAEPSRNDVGLTTSLLRKKPDGTFALKPTWKESKQSKPSEYRIRCPFSERWRIFCRQINLKVAFPFVGDRYRPGGHLWRVGTEIDVTKKCPQSMQESKRPFVFFLRRDHFELTYMRGASRFATSNSLCTSWFTQKRHLLAKMGQIAAQQLLSDVAARAAHLLWQGSATPRERETLTLSAALCTPG